jgi:hypothetical protein
MKFDGKFWRPEADEITAIMDMVETAPLSVQLNVIRLICKTAPIIVAHSRVQAWTERNAAEIAEISRKGH